MSKKNYKLIEPTKKEVELPKTELGYADTVVHDFRRNMPYWSYRPVKYQVYPPFKEMKAEIDQYLDRLFSGDIDEGNADVLDGLIIDMARKALYHLDGQRVERQDMIRSLYTRFQSDKASFRNQMKHLQEALEENLEEQDTVARLLRKDEYSDYRRKSHEE